MRKHLIFLLCTLCSFALQANDQYAFKRLDVSAGLSTNQTQCIFKDSKGFVWFGTASGLNRYDGADFKIFRNNPRDTTSLPDDNIISIQEAADGRLWINTPSYYTVYDPKTETFLHDIQTEVHKLGVNESVQKVVIDNDKNFWLFSRNKNAFVYDTQSKHTRLFFSHSPYGSVTDMKRSGKNYWFVFDSGMIVCYDYATRNIVFRSDFLKKRLANASHVVNLFVDNEGDLWFYSKGHDFGGIILFNPGTGNWLELNETSSRFRLSSNTIAAILQDGKNNVWIATDHGGIDIINKKNNSVQYFKNNPDDERSVSQNSITDLYKDNNGIIWVATYKNGICYYHESIYKFARIHHEASNSNSLPANDINCFYEDKTGNLWLGTNGDGLLVYHPNQKSYTVYRHNPANGNSLCSDVVVCLQPDREGNLWIGTYLGGLDCFDGHRFIHYKNKDQGSQEQSPNNVFSALEDSKGQLWVGILGKGICLLNKKTGQFIPLSNKITRGSDFNYPTCILETRSGKILFGSSNGIGSYDLHTDRFSNHNIQSQQYWKISNSSINCLLEDSRGLIWMGTNEGINLYNPKTGRIQSFLQSDGLPDNTVHTIVEDNRHTLWIGTINGLSNAQLHWDAPSNSYKINFINYDESDGLQSREFNRYAAYKMRNGELLFGGLNGYNRFFPEQITYNHIHPHVIFTDLQIFNKSIRVGEKCRGRIVLPQPIDEIKEIKLKYNENVFAIEFSGQNYFVPEKTRYEYKLENFDSHWISITAKKGKVTYTNLNPGTYTLKVRAANNDLHWNDQPAELVITVLPPFWLTIWAKIIYLLLIITAIFTGRKMILVKMRKKFQREQEIRETKRMHELDEMKLRFFTNISHEFRTPISLIISPLERLMKEKHTGDEKDLFAMMHRNATQLLHLVNELLDFRKLEMAGHTLSLSYGDLIGFTKDLCYSFAEMSVKKAVRLIFKSNVHELKGEFDEDKLGKIISNLLSNAFKFTPEGGTITVEIEMPSSGNEDKNSVVIKVTDTGIGIAKEDHEKIFDRFYQVTHPRVKTGLGSGIGLHLAKEFASLMGGSIEVTSELGKGSCFMLKLPFVKIAEETTIAIPSDTTIEPAFEKEEDKPKTPTSGKEKPLLLIVDDNDDFRHFLKINLQTSYRIVDACDGEEAWNIIPDKMPDLVISDVMMPKMDGMELCRLLKNDERTCAIPIILLTAKNTDESKLEGLEEGADEYISKPFNMDILLLRVNWLIAIRKTTSNTTRKLLEITPSNVLSETADDKLLHKAIEYVEKNMERPEFSVEELSREMGMSRATLYKKLLEITGKTPVEFIRIVRLKRAAQLLVTDQLTISEIAFRVGFNYPKYFRQYFKEEFGMSPSAYAKTPPQPCPEGKGGI